MSISGCVIRFCKYQVFWQHRHDFYLHTFPGRVFMEGLAFHYLSFHNIKLPFAEPHSSEAGRCSNEVSILTIPPKETPLVKVTNDLHVAKSNGSVSKPGPIPLRLVPGQSSSQLMVILSSWLLSPKSLESSLTLFISHMPCPILHQQMCPECHHFSPPPLIPWARPYLAPQYGNGFFRVFLCRPCPLIVYFLKMLSHITSLLCSNPPMSSHLTQKYIPTLCSNDTLSVRSSPNALYSTAISPTFYPDRHLYTHCPQNQKFPSPFTFLFPL